MMIDQTSIFDFIEDDAPIVAPVEKPTFTPRSVNFKAWDTEEKRWMNHSFVIEHRVLALERNDGRFVFVQGTGVVDSKGNEVYDGSILEIRGGKYKCRQRVYYNATKGYWTTDDYALFIIASNAGWSFEVVGHVLDGE